MLVLETGEQLILEYGGNIMAETKKNWFLADKKDNVKDSDTVLVYDGASSYTVEVGAINSESKKIKNIIHGEDWYVPNPILGTKSGENGVPSERTIENYEEHFNWSLNKLVNRFPKYVTKSVLGRDTSNTYDIYKYEFTPKNYEKTILIFGCLHGNEYTSFYGLCRFLEEVCDEDYSDPNLNYIKNNIRMVVVPMVNPWGFINKRRQNVNGVDLNRNFDYRWNEYTYKALQGETYYKGTNPLSEAESMLMRDLAEELKNDNLVASIDFHTITTIEAEKILYYPRFHNNEITALSNVVKRFEYGENRAIFSSSAVPSLSNYISWKYKINCCNPEWNNRCYEPISGYRDELNMTKWVEWAGNIIISLARHSKKREFKKAQPFIKHLIFNADKTLTGEDSNRMSSKGYNIVNSSAKAYNSMNISKYEFKLDQHYTINTSGYIKVVAEKDTLIHIQPMIYQKNNPEQNYSTVSEERRFEVVMNVKAGNEYFIPVNASLHGFHTNYNTDSSSRSDVVHFRIRAYCDTSDSAYIESYNVSIHGVPSDLGKSVTIEKTHEQVDVSSGKAEGLINIFPTRVPDVEENESDDENIED